MTDATPETRWCSACSQERPWSAFSPSTSWCRTCVAYHARRRKVIDYDTELAAQDGVCALCLKPPGKKRLCIDHDHRTGRFRGLLCDRCNQLLGRADDSIIMLRRAIDYLEKPGRELAVPPLKRDQQQVPEGFPVEISYREPSPQPPRRPPATWIPHRYLDRGPR